MTQTALAKTESLAIQTARELKISDSQLQLVKDTFAKGATDDELSLFLMTAHRTGLDPMARQLFLVKRWDSSLKREAMTIQISIDGFRLIADRTNKYVPGREATYTYDKNGNLESATAYIKKFAGGIWHEVSATAFHSEYVQTTKEGNPNRMWQKMPRLMLAKTAESLVLRKAFPAELSGLYTDSEMGTVSPTEDAVQSPPSKLQLVEQARKETAAPKQDADPLGKQIAERCANLNDAGDAILWKGATLTDYANELFDTDLDSWQKLDAEKKEVLLGDLTGRLDEINERAAIATQDEPDAVEGEVVQETEAAF